MEVFYHDFRNFFSCQIFFFPNELKLLLGAGILKSSRQKVPC